MEGFRLKIRRSIQLSYGGFIYFSIIYGPTVNTEFRIAGVW
jgi:hypothetical protein